LKTAKDLPFALTKLGHVVLNCSDLERSVKFYTEVLGFKISDVYGDDMMDGGMIFMRFNADHHGIALVGTMTGPSPNVELNHLAFEVDTLDEVVLARNHLKKHGVPSTSRAADAPVCRSPSNSAIPTATASKSIGAWIGSDPMDTFGPRTNGKAQKHCATPLPIR
jgi:catechol 2,3-dioxygenase-like lactoylglutathione lyase family enzyme